MNKTTSLITVIGLVPFIVPFTHASELVSAEESTYYSNNAIRLKLDVSEDERENSDEVGLSPNLIASLAKFKHEYLEKPAAKHKNPQIKKQLGKAQSNKARRYTRKQRNFPIFQSR